MHVPVMPRECLDFLNIQPGGGYLGGHTGAIARKLVELSGGGLVLACDRDAESLELARANTADCASSPGGTPRIRFHQALFSQLGEVLAAEGMGQVDGLLADLGVSRYQLSVGERGFSLMADGPLDMRMSRDRGVSNRQQRTAAEIVNYESEHELAQLIFQWGEERRSRQIARAIVRARPIQTTGQLAKLIEGVARRTGKIHPATQTFMALRMVVNNEMEELDALLASLPRLVRAGGRVVMLTFMSIEDRKVKQNFQAMAKTGRARLLTRHVVRPAQPEIRDNPSSRSAMLRAIELQ
jgi:16S rRNA (cytosine1402-N4)-methyltransferase